MVFRPPYQFPMYPGGMGMPRMPMQMPMQMPPQMSPQSFFPPGGFPNQARMPGGFPMSSGIGSFGGQMPMPSMQEPSKIGSFLQQANSLFNSAKTYTPYIQQAMPMVKNIPSLLKLYKGFQGLPAAGAAAGAGAVAAEAAASGGGGSSKSRKASRENTSYTPANPLPSKPRIFQPPM
ncbi:4-hydroxy-3-methylbut-2-enyl diphosphate reductase [Lysinibacillus sp. KCTC 33748]|uniref:VrrA/YqfQ family protein n=1 Tax=unclassified Lysinibacillus TaxID=2636778 RepID=UPI0009A80B09|nr:MULTISPECIES: VrrA/YqfQ family protein [unclassified Lysinibacillus]OXS66517.1 4-hydroxy-3-methylbut-2-enyl diphosphate reductase [Lysinibacillus sp. KCTC 33748]SKC16996.1 YqfQ-like protein [Lysinibacillus sp. AC-3]